MSRQSDMLLLSDKSRQSDVSLQTDNLRESDKLCQSGMLLPSDRSRQSGLSLQSDISRRFDKLRQSEMSLHLNSHGSDPLEPMVEELTTERVPLVTKSMSHSESFKKVDMSVENLEEEEEMANDDDKPEVALDKLTTSVSQFVLADAIKAIMAEIEMDASDESEEVDAPTAHAVAKVNTFYSVLQSILSVLLLLAHRSELRVLVFDF